MNEQAAKMKNTDEVKRQIETVASCIWRREIWKWTHKMQTVEEKKGFS